MPTPAETKRRDIARKAWSELYQRLDNVRCSDYAYTRAMGDAEKAAIEETHRYIIGDKSAKPSDALKRFEEAAVAAFKAKTLERGCNECGIEKVVEVIDSDGVRACGRCRAGMP